MFKDLTKNGQITHVPQINLTLNKKGKRKRVDY